MGCGGDVPTEPCPHMMIINKENGFTLKTGWHLPDLRMYVFVVGSLLIFLAIIYGNSFFGEWHFDDYHNIVNNRTVHVKLLSWEEIQKTFYGSYGTEKQHVSRPLAFLSFGLNYFWGGAEVVGYHIVNFAIHWISAIFLFLFIYNTLKLPLLRDRYGQSAYAIALLSTFFWATSPLQVNAVTYVVQRMASMAGLFYVMSMYLYLRARTASAARCRIAFYSFSGMCALAAFGTKENTAVLPVTLLLFDLFFIQGVSAHSAKKALKWAVPSLAVVIGLGLIYIDFSSVLGIYEAGVRPFSPMERLLTQGRVLFFYASLLLYPIPSRLTFLHDIDISRSLLDPWTTLAAIVGIALCLLFASVKAKKYPLLSFAVLFFFLNHLIEGTVIPLELIYEHRNYIPSMFFFVPIAVLMVRCLDYFSYHKGIQVFMAAGFALLLAFQGHTTFERNAVVSSDLHLWLDNVRKAPNLSRPRINLARHYYEAGMYEQAYGELKTAEDLNRDTNLRQIGIASYNLGVYYLYQAKDIDRAEHQFIKALERFPGYPSAIVGLATVHLQRGDIEKAWTLMKEQAPRHRNDAEMINCYGLVLLKKGNAKDALKAAARTMELKWNDPQPWEISGEAWRKLGQWQKAAQCWKEALRLDPTNPRAHLALVELYDRIGDPALTRTAVRCMALKGAKPMDEWLAELEENSRVSAYEVNPGQLGRIIRREIGRELTR